MKNVIGSSVRFDAEENLYAVEFMDCIEDLLELDEVKRLDEYFQHCNTSRLQHCLNVAYYSYLMARAFNFDYRSAARAGMLHDLFWYDWRVEKTPQLHAFYHPKNALENAEKIAELNNIERDAIVKHMWPLTLSFPRYKESYIVTLSDKYCACIEIVNQYYNCIKRGCRSFKHMFFRKAATLPVSYEKTPKS